MKNKILYAITNEDVMTVLGEKRVYSERDLQFIADKIGDFIGDRWYGAIEYALGEMKRKN